MGDGGQVDPMASARLEAAAFCAEVAEVVCGADRACCTLDPDGDGGDGDEEMEIEPCEDRQRTACETSVAPLLEDPRTAYDPVRGREFVDALIDQASGCYAQPPRLTDFLEIFEGTGVADADCTPTSLDAKQLRIAQLSCQGDLTCHLYMRSDGTRLGVCEERTDAACSHAFDCVAGQWCNLPANWEPGRWGMCQPLRADGWGCASDHECESQFCDVNKICAEPIEGRYCSMVGYRSTVLHTNPVGYWPLGDMETGAARDLMANGYDGSYAGTPGSATGALKEAEDDGALAIAGLDDYAELPAIAEVASGTALTIEAWFRRSATSVTGPLVEFHEEETRGAHMWNHSAADMVYVNFYDQNAESHTVVSPEGTIAADTWYHVAATYDGAVGRLYVNGTQVGEVAGAFRVRSDLPLRIGSRTGDERGILGAIDEVAIYDRALPASRLQLHHRRGTEGPAPQSFVLFRWLN
jgi:hypothetical protein